MKLEEMKFDMDIQLLKFDLDERCASTMECKATVETMSILVEEFE